MKAIETGYELIPMSEITDEAREIAVAWMECEDKDWIGQKHKLASDIMNYAKKFAETENKEIIKKYIHCSSCGTPLSRDCPHCKELWES
jgi:hypothetical protein